MQIKLLSLLFLLYAPVNAAPLPHSALSSYLPLPTASHQIILQKRAKFDTVFNVNEFKAMNDAIHVHEVSLADIVKLNNEGLAEVTANYKKEKAIYTAMSGEENASKLTQEQHAQWISSWKSHEELLSFEKVHQLTEKSVAWRNMKAAEEMRIQVKADAKERIKSGEAILKSATDKREAYVQLAEDARPTQIGTYVVGGVAVVGAVGVYETFKD